MGDGTQAGVGMGVAGTGWQAAAMSRNRAAVRTAADDLILEQITQ
jgi:hypothetical protein